MPTEKVEPRLRHEMDRARTEGQADRVIPVLIEHAHSVQAPAGEFRGGGLAELEEKVHALQQGIVDRLEELGAGDIERSVLANAISASLDASGIEDIASRDDVRIVRLNRLDQVTC